MVLGDQAVFNAKNDSGYHFRAQEFLCPKSIFSNFSVMIKIVGNENCN